MTSTDAKPHVGLSLNDLADEQGTSALFRVSGYFDGPTRDLILAHCWYQDISQCDFIEEVMTTQVEQLQRSGELTPEVINEYRKKHRNRPYRKTRNRSA